MSRNQQDIDAIISSRLIGNSAAMVKVRGQVARVARLKATVLITGETGVGKEVVAQAIREISLREARLFKAINCGVFTDELLISEIFGHEKGAFTGAVKQRKGAFEQINGGTLFLDEVGDMSKKGQVKLLRVIETQEFTRLGGNDDISVDVRIIAATNIDLETLMQQKKFREDLYYRLNLFPIHIPPLRERPEDIRDLINKFVADLNTDYGRSITGLTKEALFYLENAKWSGNARELKNAIEAAFIQSDTEELQLEDFPFDSEPGQAALLPVQASGTQLVPTPSVGSESALYQQCVGEICAEFIHQLASSGMSSSFLSGEIQSGHTTPSDETQMGWRVPLERALDSLGTSFENEGWCIDDVKAFKKRLFDNMENEVRRLTGNEAIPIEPDMENEAIRIDSNKAATFQKVLNVYAKSLKPPNNAPDAWRAVLKKKKADRLFNTLVALMTEKVKLDALRKNAPSYKTDAGETGQCYSKGALGHIYKESLKPILKYFIGANIGLQEALDAKAIEEGRNDRSDIGKIQETLTNDAITQLDVLCGCFIATTAEDCA